jgi:hypothetical protein
MKDSACTTKFQCQQKLDFLSISYHRKINSHDTKRFHLVRLQVIRLPNTLNRGLSRADYRCQGARAPLGPGYWFRVSTSGLPVPNRRHASCRCHRLSKPSAPASAARQAYFHRVRIRHCRQLLPLYVVQCNRTCFAHHSFQNLSLTSRRQKAGISSINYEGLHEII